MPSRRSLAFGLIAVVLLAAIAYGALWFRAAATLEAAIRDWTTEQRPGLHVTIADVAIGGFPARIGATLGSIELANDDLQVRYRAQGVHIVRTLWDGASTVMVSGPQTIEFPTAAYELSARQFDVTLRLRADGSWGGFTLDMDGAALQRPAAPPATAKHVVVQVGLPSGAGTVPDGARATLRVENLTLPEQRRGPFGDTVAAATFNVELDGALHSLTPGRALPQWQREGGRLYVSNSALRWGTIDATDVGGTLRLDRNLGLAGWLDGTFRDPAPVFEAMTAVGWLEREARADLMGAVAYNPNKVLVKQYRASFVGPDVLLDDLDNHTDVPVRLFSLPSLTEAH